MTSTHTRQLSDTDWCIIERHNADPMLDITSQRAIQVHDSTPEEDFSLIAHTRPSYSSIAALKSTVTTSARASPVPTVHPQVPQLRVGGVVTSGKYREYQLKKSGKSYIARTV